MRALVLVDGQHVVAVVRAAIEHFRAAIPGSTVVAAALIGPGEKLVDGDLAHLGVPVVGGGNGGDGRNVGDPVGEALDRYRPDIVVDLSDEPVLDPELVAGYLGAYRVLLSDLVVVTMAEPTFASTGAEVLEKGIRSVAPGVRVVHTVFRPFPSGRSSVAGFSSSRPHQLRSLHPPRQ